MNYFLPIGLYVMMGLLMAKLNSPFVETMIPAMIIVSILSGTVLSLPNLLVTAREAGIFRSYKINGIPATSTLTIPALTTALHMMVVAVIITATAPLFFGTPPPVNWLGFILFFLLVAFTHAGLDMLISVISSITRAVVLWSQLIFLPSMLIGRLMIPYSTLPGALGKVGLLLPATHAMNAYQGLAQNQVAAFDPLWSALILLAGGILSCGVYLTLRHLSKNLLDEYLSTQKHVPLIVKLRDAGFDLQRRSGPAIMKWALYQAGQIGRRCDPQLARVYYREMIRYGKNHKQAMGAVMSHTGARVLAVLREDKPYELRDIDGRLTREEARRLILLDYQVPEEIKRERRRRKQVVGKAAKLDRRNRKMAAHRTTEAATAPQPVVATATSQN